MRTRTTVRGRSFGNDFMKNSGFRPIVQSVFEPYKAPRKQDLTTRMNMKKPVMETFDTVHNTFPNKVYLLKSDTENYCVSIANSGDGVIVAPLDKNNPKQWVMVTADAGTITFFNDLKNYFVFNEKKVGAVVKRGDVMKNALFTFNADKTISLRNEFNNYILGYKTPSTKPGADPQPMTYKDKTFSDLCLITGNEKSSYNHKWTFVEVADIRGILDHANEKSNLESQINNYAGQVGTLNEQINNLNTQLANQKQLYDTTTGEKDVIINRYKNQITEYEKTIRNYEGTIQAHETKLQGYEGVIKKNEDKLRGYEGVIGEYENKIRGYEDELVNYEGKLQGYEKKIGEYESGLKSYEGHLTGYEGKLLEYEGVIKDYEDVINRYEGNWFVRLFLKNDAGEHEEQEEEIVEEFSARRYGVRAKTNSGRVMVGPRKYGGGR